MSIPHFEITPEDLIEARDVLTRLHELVGRPEPPLVKAGELPELLHCSRTTAAWALAKRSDFPRPIMLGPRLRMWRRGAVISWRDAQTAESPGPDGVLNARLAVNEADAPDHLAGHNI